MPAGELLTKKWFYDFLGSVEAIAAFAKILTTMRMGLTDVRQLIASPPPRFERAADCLELLRHSCASRRYRLPPTYARLQLAALQKRFKDTSCQVDEILRRGATLLCCTGCSTIKNFVVGAGKKDQNAHVSHGYKRVCHDGSHLLCDEKRVFRCCKTVPLKSYVFIEPHAADGPVSNVLEIFGAAYTITTCCGHVVLLDKTHAVVGSPITCQRCTDEIVNVTKSSTIVFRCCHFCEQPVLRKKGSFTGIFTDGTDSLRQLTFCKRHARGFMKREHEPMDLGEVMREIPKRLRV
jgi:hypothetical protein